jgi:hypothetical protein
VIGHNSRVVGGASTGAAGTDGVSENRDPSAAGPTPGAWRRHCVIYAEGNTPDVDRRLQIRGPLWRTHCRFGRLRNSITSDNSLRCSNQCGSPWPLPRISAADHDRQAPAAVRAPNRFRAPDRTRVA